MQRAGAAGCGAAGTGESHSRTSRDFSCPAKKHADSFEARSAKVITKKQSPDCRHSIRQGSREGILRLIAVMFVALVRSCWGYSDCCSNTFTPARPLPQQALSGFHIVSALKQLLYSFSFYPSVAITTAAAGSAAAPISPKS